MAMRTSTKLPRSDTYAFWPGRRDGPWRAVIRNLIFAAVLSKLGWRCALRLAAVFALLALGAAVLPALGSAASPGQLFAFGANGWGQLGNPTNSGNNEEVVANPTPSPVTLPGEVGPVTQAAAGGGHSLVLTASGQLYAFGENYFGELGNPTNSLAGEEKEGAEEPNPTPALVTLPGALGSVTQIAAGR